MRRESLLSAHNTNCLLCLSFSDGFKIKELWQFTRLSRTALHWHMPICALTYSKNRTMRWELLDIKLLFVALKTQYFPSMMNCREALLSSVDLTPPLASCELRRELSSLDTTSFCPHWGCANIMAYRNAIKNEKVRIIDHITTSRPTSESSSKELNLGFKLNQTWTRPDLDLT